jgi:hypothetical protein
LPLSRKGLARARAFRWDEGIGGRNGLSGPITLPSVYPRLSSSLLEAERGGRRTGCAGKFAITIHQSNLTKSLKIS